MAVLINLRSNFLIQLFLNFNPKNLMHLRGARNRFLEPVVFRSKTFSYEKAQVTIRAFSLVFRLFWIVEHSYSSVSKLMMSFDFI